MRGRWELTGDDLKYWIANAKGQTLMMHKNKISIVDLTKENITPYQINQVLELLGWEIYNEFSGLEGNRYYYYRKEGLRDIVVYANILTFELIVFLKKDIENIDFKKNHIKEMLNKN